jgi:hypothetical protein
MSKFAYKLLNLSKTSTAPIGFHPALPEAKSATMLLVVELPGAQPKEVKMLTGVKADAGLILGDPSGAKAFEQIAEAAGDIPVGVVIKGADELQIDDLVKKGCDFVMFDVGTRAAILHKGAVGKFVMIERSLDQGFVRAINSLEVDGALITGGDSLLAIEHLLVCRRFVELLEKPVIVSLPSVVTKGELTSLWEVGVDAVVASSTYSAEALTELRKMIGDLPNGRRGRRTKGGVMLPRLGTDVTEEEEGDEEEEDI